MNYRLRSLTAYTLIYLTALQPLQPAFAALITPANTKTQVTSGTVPVINIAPPNNAGVSHNSYVDFNVGTPGVVLNNATKAGLSQLAGQVTANTKLGMTPAQLIINEVTSGNSSTIQGKLEVFGSKADVIIANPNGITCNGCGFINAPGVVLTTGKPRLGTGGELEALEVKKGTITIGAQGMNAGSQTYADIISRSTTLNGTITAQNLSLTLGANKVSYKDGSITSLTPEGVKPQFALDTKALGGMYANKIRLIATESGVGVNATNLNASQQDITLTSKGKLVLRQADAKTDINISASDTVLGSSSLKAGRDITLASTNLINAATVQAERDIRVFTNTFENAMGGILASGEDLWIQKDAEGNRSESITNRSGLITTSTGDVIIRTDKLNNVRDTISVSQRADFKHGKVKQGTAIHFNDLTDVDTDPTTITQKIRVTDSSLSSRQAEILAGGNLYINAGNLLNDSSQLSAGKDAILTGGKMTFLSRPLDIVDYYVNFRPENGFERMHRATTTPYNNDMGADENGLPIALKYYVAQSEKTALMTGNALTASVTAKQNVVADFSQETLILNQPSYLNSGTPLEVIRSKDVPVNFQAGKDILITTGKLDVTGQLKAGNAITLLAQGAVTGRDVVLNAGKEINLSATGAIKFRDSQFASEKISLLSRKGGIELWTDTAQPVLDTTGTRLFTTLNATKDLSLQADGDLLIGSAYLARSGPVSLIAGGTVSLKRPDALYRLNRLTPLTAEQQTKYFSDTKSKFKDIYSDGYLTINAGKNIDASGMTLLAKSGLSLMAGGDILLSPHQLGSSSSGLPSAKDPNRWDASINTGGSLLISAGRDISTQSAELFSSANITLIAGRTLSLLATAYSAIDDPDKDHLDERHFVTSLQARKDLSITTNGDLLASGTAFSSGGDMTFSAGGGMQFISLQNHKVTEYGNTFSEEYTQQPASLNSQGSLNLISNSSILFQATLLIATKALNVAARGGYLYAQAVSESNKYVAKTSDRTWYLKKIRGERTTHNVTNRVTSFRAGGNINLLSKDNSTYEASKIDAGKNATLTSTNGQVIFKAVENTAFEQNISTSKGFFIKQSDKGFNESKWVLPSIYTGGTLKIDAAAGISADVKAKSGQTLQNVLTVLGNTEGTAWMKGLNGRKDVQWNMVSDAFKNWNYTSQSLNPVVAAVIAITAAAVTAGTSIAGSAAMAVNGAGTMASGAAYAGTMTLASQAAVAMVENQGNLSKTLKALGSNESVKALATSMVIGGALAGFDSILGTTTTPQNVKLPVLNDGDWTKVAQRVAGQSVISSGVDSAINGGSYKDKLTNALLANIGNQINAQGARLIGDNGEVLGTPGKTISHAVVSAISAEIGRGNSTGAAAGALAAEMAGIILQDTYIKPEEWQTKSEQLAQMSRVLGGVAGAVFTGKADGAYSGAQGSEITFKYNYLSHQQNLQLQTELKSATTPFEQAAILAHYGLLSNSQDGAFIAGLVSGMPLEIFDSVDALVAVAGNYKTAADALLELIKNDDRFSIITDSIKQDYIERIEACKTRYEYAGIDGAFDAGLEFGKLTMSGLGLIAGVAGAGKIGVKITTNMLKVVEKNTVKRNLDLYPLTPEDLVLIKNAETVSTAKDYQTAVPRDLNESVLMNMVRQNAGTGEMLMDMNNDVRFPISAGFQKMQVVHPLYGDNVVIHYQFNTMTGQAYDVKIVSPQRFPKAK